jgi:hypothetical protein
VFVSHVKAFIPTILSCYHYHRSHYWNKFHHRHRRIHHHHHHHRRRRCRRPFCFFMLEFCVVFNSTKKLTESVVVLASLSLEPLSSSSLFEFSSFEFSSHCTIGVMLAVLIEIVAAHTKDD